MENILNESHIRIREEARDWEGAIRRAGEVLVQAGSIKPGYIDKMIRSVKELGPYIVIMPGFALAHAAPCEDVIKSDIALITLKNPVCFESPNDPVSVVLCLGCTDSSSHLDMLSAIAELLMEEEGLQDTPNKMIHIGKPIEFDMDAFSRQLDKLYEVANLDSEVIRDEVKRIVPTYQIKRLRNQFNEKRC